MSIFTLLRKRIPLKNVYGVISALLLFLGTAIIAAHAEGETGLKELATNIQSNLGPVETVIIAVLYIGGVGFAGASIMKFKQYKENPQQVQLGQPIALAFIAAALIWLPRMVKMIGQTVFGSTEGQGSANQQGGIFE